MIFNTTYKNRDAKATINDLIGKSYSLLESIKMKGVGSKRMMIDDVSIGFKKILNEENAKEAGGHDNITAVLAAVRWTVWIRII